MNRERSAADPQPNPLLLILDWLDGDEEDFSELLQFRLRHLDYEVLSAATGTEALNRARSESPDAILLDLLLPDLDGLTVCEILRRQLSARETPIFVITVVTTEAAQHAARIAGADGFLGKPLDFDQLKASLSQNSKSRSLPKQPPRRLC